MKKLLLILLLSANTLFSQGFGWELSPRLFEKTSEYFLGIDLKFGLSQEIGDFSFYENDCQCGKFSNGKGKRQHFAILIEKWSDNGKASYIASLGMSLNINLFSTKHSLPILLPNGNETLITYENRFESNLQNFNFTFEYKKRLFESFYFFSIGCHSFYSFQNNQKHIEKILSPNANPFPTNPPSYNRVVSNGKINDLRNFNFHPFLSFGKDIDLGFRYYLSPYIHLSYSLLSQIKGEKWNSLQGTLGLRIMRWAN